LNFKYNLLFIIALLHSIIEPIEIDFPDPWLNNAIIIVDSANKSDYFSSGDNTAYDLAQAIDQQAAPIIVTSAVLHSFLSRREKWYESEKSPKRHEYYINAVMPDIIKLIKPLLKNTSSQATEIKKNLKEKLTQLKEKIKEITYPHIFTTFPNLIIDQTLNYLFSQIHFVDKDWEIYETFDNEWFLLVPKKYINRTLQKWETGTYTKHIEELKELIKKTNKNSEKELKIIDSLQNSLKNPIEKKSLLLGLQLNNPNILQLTSINEINKKLDFFSFTPVSVQTLQKIFLEKKDNLIGRWIFWIIGHGTSSTILKQAVRTLLLQDISYLQNFKNEIAKTKALNQPITAPQIRYINEILKKYHFKTVNIEMSFSTLQSLVNNAIENLQDRFDNLYKKTIDELKSQYEFDPNARITGFKLADFRDLLLFFNNQLKTNLLYYYTCFGGGYHLSAPYFKNIQSIHKQNLKKINALDLNYTVIAAVTTDVGVAIYRSTTFLNNPDNLFLMNKLYNQTWKNKIFEGFPVHNDFLGFFKATNNFYKNKKITKKRQDPFNVILSHTLFNPKLREFKEVRHGLLILNPIPSIRFPHSSFFTVPKLGEDIDIINYVKAKQIELEKKPIILRKEIALIYPFILPINIIIQRNDNKELPIIISMGQGPSIQFISRIETQNSLNELLSKSFWSTPYAVPKYFVIKKLITQNKNKSLNIFQNIVIRVYKDNNFFYGKNFEGKYFSGDEKTIELEKDQEEAKGIALELINDWYSFATDYSISNISPWFIPLKKLKQEMIDLLKD